jgi:NAD(P)H-dependent FMN reductase
MTRYKVGYLVGSLATASINRRLARALIRLPPEGLEFDEISFRDLPLYSYDYDDDFPPAARAFKAAIAASDAVLFVTPEYNRSIPGGLKNAIDWASRPYGTNAFARKPSAVIGASPGAIGTAVAQQHLRSVLRNDPSNTLSLRLRALECRARLCQSDLRPDSTSENVGDLCACAAWFASRLRNLCLIFDCSGASGRRCLRANESPGAAAAAICILPISCSPD